MMSVRSNLLLVAPLLATPLSGCFSPSLDPDTVQTESESGGGTTDGEPMAGPTDDGGEDSDGGPVSPTDEGSGETTSGVDDGTPGDTTDGDTTDGDTSDGDTTDGDQTSDGPAETGSTDDGATETGTDEGVTAECGDGIVEGAEECDAGGLPSGDCDADCTAVECGDGVVNLLAGEVCEPGDEFENANCDACVVACEPGFADCDAAVGCEMALNSFANCESCGMEPVSYFLTPQETVSMSDDELWMDDDVLAVSSGGDEFTGWLGFDVSELPDEGWPILGFMTLHMVDEPGNPSNVPGITILHSDANDWANGIVMPGEIESAGNLSIGQWNLTEGNYQAGAANLIQLTFGNGVDQWWPADAQDEWLTVGVNETNDDERSVLFWGLGGGETDPQLQIVLCE